MLNKIAFIHICNAFYGGEAFYNYSFGPQGMFAEQNVIKNPQI